MVSLKNCSVETFINYAQGKRVYCFGESFYIHSFLKGNKYNFEKIIHSFTDNNPDKWGTKVIANDCTIPVISVNDFTNGINKNDIILITTGSFFLEILEQLDNIEFLNGIDCFLLPYVEECESKIDDSDLQAKIVAAKKNEQQIPKKIHYCWFGGNKIPDVMKECMGSWSKFCPDYEIIRWDESNYDVAKHKYTYSAYKQSAWAYVSDYARTDILYEYGGIYLDTDVELIKSLDDLLYHEAFIGYMDNKLIESGSGFGARKKFSLLHSIFSDFLIDEEYSEKNLLKLRNKHLNTLFSQGFRFDGAFQYLDGMAIYPKEFFTPLNPITGTLKITPNTYSIHRYIRSWDGKVQSNKNKILNFQNELKNRMQDISERVKN